MLLRRLGIRQAVPDRDVLDDGTALVWLAALNEAAPGKGV